MTRRGTLRSGVPLRSSCSTNWPSGSSQPALAQSGKAFSAIHSRNRVKGSPTRAECLIALSFLHTSQSLLDEFVEVSAGKFKAADSGSAGRCYVAVLISNKEASGWIDPKARHQLEYHAWRGLAAGTDAGVLRDGRIRQMRAIRKGVHDAAFCCDLGCH